MKLDRVVVLTSTPTTNTAGGAHTAGDKVKLTFGRP